MTRDLNSGLESGSDAVPMGCPPHGRQALIATILLACASSFPLAAADVPPESWPAAMSLDARESATPAASLFVEQHGLDQHVSGLQLGAGNIGLIEQQGSASSAHLQQAGASQRASVWQDGMANRALVQQAGTNNNAEVEQRGSGNEAEIDQWGSDGFAEIRQVGDNNLASIAQRGDGLTGQIHQIGSNNVYHLFSSGPESAQISVIQVGDSAPPVLITPGN
ncbi:MAG TPA: hypothetical protein VFX11_16720 [Candidatus Kapabacteria bacterium]|nr:hypothetical protein [Candidatus Kapabacteria bacterium]